MSRKLLVAIPCALALLFGASSTAFAQEDGEIAAVQRKAYVVGHRSEFSLALGMPINDAFLRGYGITAGYDYHFNEFHGLHLSGQYRLNSKTGLTQTLEAPASQGGFAESVAATGIMALVGADYTFRPVYGKINFFSEIVAHFDLYLTAGVAFVVTQSLPSDASGLQPQIASYPGGSLGLGQRYFLTQELTFRWDLHWTMFPETVTDPTTSNPITRLRNDVQLMLGISYLL